MGFPHCDFVNVSRILAMMDGLPKKLPTENIPVSNDWVSNAVAPVEQMDYSS